MYFFFAPNINNPIHVMEGEESKHLSRVLRLKVGEMVALTDGEGLLYTAQIASISDSSTTLRITGTEKAYHAPYTLSIAVAPTKNTERFEWFMEKATEIGIDIITPVVCAHSERKVQKTERGKKILVSALKQSHKAYLPTLNEVCSLKDFVSRQSQDSLKLIATCEDLVEKAPIEFVLMEDSGNLQKEIVILIGPEGDFTRQEVSLAMEHGFRPISLGKSILRTETAALMAVAAPYILASIAPYKPL